MCCLGQGRGTFSMATDLEGNLTASKEFQVDMGILKRSPALTHYKARED